MMRTETSLSFCKTVTSTQSAVGFCLRLNTPEKQLSPCPQLPESTKRVYLYEKPESGTSHWRTERGLKGVFHSVIQTWRHLQLTVGRCSVQPCLFVLDENPGSDPTVSLNKRHFLFADRWKCSFFRQHEHYQNLWSVRFSSLADCSANWCSWVRFVPDNQRWKYPRWHKSYSRHGKLHLYPWTPMESSYRSQAVAKAI
jgi:hypothetical protein